MSINHRISACYFVTCKVNQKLTTIKTHLLIGSILLLLACSGNAQSAYSLQNLKQASSEELRVYYQKSLNLQRNGEITALTGGIVGLLGILAGAAITDNNSSNGNSNVWGITAATMLVGGSVATVVGFSMYMTGASRINRINEIRNTELLRLELTPNVFYCGQLRNYQPGITLRVSF